MSTERTYRKIPPPRLRKTWIEQYYNKKVTLESLAKESGYPLSTVYYWVKKMDPERKTRSDKGKPRDSVTIEMPDIPKMTLDGHSLEENAELIMSALQQQITINRKIKARDAIYLTGQITLQIKRLRSIQFDLMAKNLDIKIVQSIIRRYEPNASPMRAIEIIKEEAARVKQEKTSRFRTVKID